MIDPKRRAGTRGIYRPGKSRFWHYDFVVAGVRHRGSTETTDEEVALAFARQKKQELKNRPSELREMRLDEAAARFQSEHQTEGTPVYAGGSVARLVEILGPATLLSQIDTAAVRRLLTALEQQKILLNTRYTYRSILSGILKYAIEWKVVTTPIAWWRLRQRKPDPRQRAPQAWELKLLQSRVDPDLFDALDLKWRIGCRRSELVALTWDCVDWEAGTLTYLSGKGRRLVELPLVGGLRRLLERRWGRHPTFILTRTQTRRYRRGAVWYEPGDQVPWEPSDLAARLRKAVRQLGLPRLVLHDFRRAYGTIGTRVTKNLTLVGQTMGHADFSTTERAYAHVLAADEREALERAEAYRDMLLANALLTPAGGVAAPSRHAKATSASTAPTPPAEAPHAGRGRDAAK